MVVGGGGGEGAGGSTAKTLKYHSSVDSCDQQCQQRADNVHIMLAKSKPETAIVTPLAMLARCATGSNKPGFRM